MANFPALKTSDYSYLDTTLPQRIRDTYIKDAKREQESPKLAIIGAIACSIICLIGVTLVIVFAKIPLQSEVYGVTSFRVMMGFASGLLGVAGLICFVIAAVQICKIKKNNGKEIEKHQRTAINDYYRDRLQQNEMFAIDNPKTKTLTFISCNGASKQVEYISYKGRPEEAYQEFCRKNASFRQNAHFVSLEDLVMRNQ